MNAVFSLARFRAVLVKEFIQMRRDHITFGMMIVLPIVQLMLFGFAINADPRHLPTMVEVVDNGPLTRAKKFCSILYQFPDLQNRAYPPEIKFIHKAC